MAFEEAHVIGCCEALQVDANIFKQIENHLARIFRIHNTLGSTVADGGFAINHMFIAFSMATKIIVIIQNQNLFVRAMLLLEEISSS